MSDDPRKKENTCHHKRFRIVADYVEEYTEQTLYAECEECGQKKSVLIDWTRDWASVGPCSEGEFETNSKRGFDNKRRGWSKNE